MNVPNTTREHSEYNIFNLLQIFFKNPSSNIIEIINLGNTHYRNHFTEGQLRNNDNDTIYLLGDLLSQSPDSKDTLLDTLFRLEEYLVSAQCYHEILVARQYHILDKKLWSLKAILKNSLSRFIIDISDKQYNKYIAILPYDKYPQNKNLLVDSINKVLASPPFSQCSESSSSDNLVHYNF